MSAIPAPVDLASIYSDHGRWLKSWLRHRLGNDGDAADLAQDVFVRLLLRPPAHTFASQEQARSYLSKMAGHMCINLWRRRAVEQAWLDTLAARPQAVAPSPEQRAIVLETLQEIAAVMRALPGQGPRVFLLAMVCGMTDKEVAQELGISSRMVRKYVVRATLSCMQIKARHLADGCEPLL